MSVDKPISDAPTIKDRLRFASESALEEFELELPGLIKEWEEFIKDNPGISFRDWYHSKEPTRVIQLKNGGDVEKYKDAENKDAEKRRTEIKTPEKDVRK